MPERFPPVRAIVISEDEGNISEIEVDISSEKTDIFRILKGPATFIGMCYDTNIVAMKCRESVFKLLENRNKLPPPFDKDTDPIYGPVLLIRMNTASDPEDLTLEEFSQLAALSES